MALPHAETTNRGFGIVRFTDANGVQCSVQESSAIGDSEWAWDNPGSSYLWVGTDDADPKYLRPGCGWVPYEIPKEVLLNTRMHLDREGVQRLIGLLQCWLG